jgi:spore coat protein U-like protein
MKKRTLNIFYIAAACTILCCADAALAACTVSTTNVNFGNYDVFSATPRDSTGMISVFCNARTTITAAIGPSPNSGGFSPRQMKLTTGTDLLNYNLYRNSTRTQIWGDGTGGTYTLSWTVSRNKTVSRTVYGRILPLQDVPAGNYNETLTVTITY